MNWKEPAIIIGIVSALSLGFIAIDERLDTFRYRVLELILGIQQDVTKLKCRVYEKPDCEPGE